MFDLRWEQQSCLSSFGRAGWWDGRRAGSDRADDQFILELDDGQISLIPATVPAAYISPMEPSGMHYFPLAWPFLLMLVVLFFMVVGILELQILSYAYARMGVHPRYIFAILFLSLFGSYVNIPVARLPAERVVSNDEVSFFGVRYVEPTEHEWPGTVIAVNVGGALIPTALALYLMVKNRLFVRGVLAIVIVAMITHQLARTVRGIGISVPIFVPPLTAALVAMLLAWRRAPALAYIGGTLGTLIGADLLNLDKIQGLGAPIASIGGAGTFDGVFLTGIVAVLLPPMGPVPRPT